MDVFFVLQGVEGCLEFSLHFLTKTNKQINSLIFKNLSLIRKSRQLLFSQQSTLLIDRKEKTILLTRCLSLLLTPPLLPNIVSKISLKAQTPTYAPPKHLTEIQLMEEKL